MADALNVLESPGTLFVLAFITHPKRTKLAVALVGGAYVVPDDTVKFRAVRLGLVAAAAVTMYKPAKPLLDLLLLAAENLGFLAGKLFKTAAAAEEALKGPAERAEATQRMRDAMKDNFDSTDGGAYEPGSPGEIVKAGKLVKYYKDPKSVTPTDANEGYANSDEVLGQLENLADAFRV